jgi:hypothetical protein
MQSLNMKPTTAEAQTSSLVSSNPARDSTTSLTETTNPEADKTDKTPPKGKVKELKGEAARKSRAGVRIREEAADQNNNDSVRPFPKHTYPPLIPLPPPKEIPAATLPPPVQETKRSAKNGKGATAATPVPPAPTPAPPVSHVHYSTPAHEAVATARTQTYAQYAQHYTKALADVELARSVLLDEEQRDFDYLTQALVTLHKQHRV